jgi:mono/diheme cytochrome c family protein
MTAVPSRDGRQDAIIRGDDSELIQSCAGCHGSNAKGYGPYR